MVSKRVKYARAHLSRGKHTALLARPLWIHFQKDINIIENPFSVSRAALKFRPTKRIKIMARPKSTKKKYDPAMKPLTYFKIPPAALNAKASNRIKDLSLPQKRAGVIYTNETTHIIPIELHLRSVWRNKLKRFLAKPADWERHKKVLDRIAKPKRKQIPKPLPVKRLRKWRKYDPIRVEILAQPMTREPPAKRDAFKVQPSALKYEMTDKMRELAYKTYPRYSIKPRIPGLISKAALEFMPNERINILAQPPTRPPGRETDLKENAFDVPPGALKAWCSPRIKVLAKHRRRV